MHVGLLGGTFDPIHTGHLRLADAALKLLALDQVLLAPVGRQPLKTAEAGAAFPDRLAMVSLAIAGHAGLALSLLDAPRQDGQPNYTVDTLRQLRASLTDDCRITLVFGADAFSSLRQWRAPEAIVQMADLCVATRPGYTLPEGQTLARMLPESARLLGREETGSVQSSVFLCAGALVRVAELRDLDEDVSATQLRHELPTGKGFDRLPPAVAAYIREHNLYRQGIVDMNAQLRGQTE